MTQILSERRDLLIRVAKLYFLEGLTQQAVANSVGLSRSNVSRLLKACREQKIVEIRVHEDHPGPPELATRLRERYSLRMAITVPDGTDPERVAAEAGEAAAALMERELHDGMTVGLSWGRAVYHTVSAFRPNRSWAVDVVQLMGSLEARDSASDGSELARRLAASLGGRCYLLQAPLYLRNEATRQALLQEPEIRRVLERARKADVALVGIGTNLPGANALVRAGHLTEEESAQLLRRGVVGNVLGRLIDIQGRVCAVPLNQRVMALEAEALRQLPLVIGVATGVEKAGAVLGALRGRLVTALVTDARTARQVLDEESGR
jgi:deoxyribonucleoside regulator